MQISPDTANTLLMAGDPQGRSLETWRTLADTGQITATDLDGKLLVTDNQGDWLPASKLIQLTPGDFYGWRAPGDDRDYGPVAPPALWLPQNEIGNSPTQPLVLTQGPYVFF